MGDVCLRSEIPADNPQKSSVEAAIESVLSQLSGSWSAEISLSRAARWWLISVSRMGDGFQGSVFVNPEDQHPEAVQRLVAGSIQHLR
jgi:hypothetical protein